MTKSILKKEQGRLCSYTKKPLELSAFCNFHKDYCKVYVKPVREKNFLCCKKLESNLFWCSYFNHLFSKQEMWDLSLPKCLGLLI